jgi:parallel beta-helix repeat protein
MRKKIIGICVCMLLVVATLPLSSGKASVQVASSTISQTVQQPPEVWVDWDYGNGNDEDDNNDDALDPTHYKTIQQGVDAVTEGGTVNVCDVTSNPGEYHENVYINKSLILTPCAPDFTAVIINGQKKAKHTITINADNVKIICGTEYGDAMFWITNFIDGFDGIYSRGHNDIKIIGNNFVSNHRDGINLDNCQRVTISNNIIRHNEKNGILLENNCERIEIIDNSIIFNKENGTLVQDCKYVTINENKIQINERNGISLQNCHFMEIKDNEVWKNHESGFNLDNCKHVTVEGNTIDDNDNDGIFLEDNCEDVTVNKNPSISRNGEGIYLWNCKDITINENTIDENEESGISLNNCEDIKINKNPSISRNGKYGIHLKKNCKDITINENTIDDNKKNGILLEDNCEDIKINKNPSISRNGEDGVYLWNCKYITINENTIDDNENNGILLWNCEDITVNKNPSISRNGKGITGITDGSNILLYKCKKIKITNNPKIDHSEGVGIFILEESENINVINNRITNSGDDGINCKHKPSSHPDVDDPNWPKNIKIIDNTISQSAHEQIHIYSGKDILIKHNTIKNGDITGITINPTGGSNIVIHDNTITGNGRVDPDFLSGIFILTHREVKVIDNTIKDNKGEGILIEGDDDPLTSNEGHVIEENTIQNNGWSGIYIKYESDNNIIKYNTIDHNGYASDDHCGIRISHENSNNNKIYHNNLIDNSKVNNKQACDDGDNVWDNGYPSGGNYWDDFDEVAEGAYDLFHGANQDKRGRDGIVDKGGVAGGKNPYDIPGGGDNRDNYPVMEPNGWIIRKPNKPDKPKGPDSGKIGTEYEYRFRSTDPEGFKLYYYVDWGDNTTTGWIGPFVSGQEIRIRHTWNKEGTYEIRVKVKNTREAESEWSDPLSITMPKTKLINRVFLRLLEQYTSMSLVLLFLLQRMVD